MFDECFAAAKEAYTATRPAYKLDETALINAINAAIATYDLLSAAPQASATAQEPERRASEASASQKADEALGDDPLADLVRRFSAALLEKLRSAEQKYGYDNSWMQPDWPETLVIKLAEHIAKGDPRDVAAYCAFAWHHGWSVATPHPPLMAQETGAVDEQAELFRDAWRYRRLQVLGAAPNGSKNLADGTVLRWSTLDAFIDEDKRVVPSRGEFGILSALSPSPQQPVEQANAVDLYKGAFEIAHGALIGIGTGTGPWPDYARRVADDLTTIVVKHDAQALRASSNGEG